MTVDSADAAVGFESSSDRPSCTAMLVAQLAAYAIFALVCVAGWLWGIGEAVIVVVAAAALLAFVIAWPLRADVVARIVAAIAGAVSIAAAALPARPCSHAAVAAGNRRSSSAAAASPFVTNGSIQSNDTAARFFSSGPTPSFRPRE